MEGPNEENLENIRIPIDRHFTWKFFDMDIDEEDACLLDKKYRKNSPVREFVKWINKKLDRECHPQHPWPVIRKQVESIALKKQILKKDFRSVTVSSLPISFILDITLMENGTFIDRYEEGRFKLENLYRKVRFLLFKWIILQIVK